MKKPAVFFLIFQIIITCFSCNREPEKIIGMKIYDYSGDFNLLTDKWKEMGINTAFISKELAANKDFRQTLKENNIKVYIIFPVFYDPVLLKQDSTLYAITNKGRIAKDDWVEFVCPSHTAYRTLKINEAADLVNKLEPDGLSIDFIRQFVYWEMIYPDRTAESIEAACFCDSCIGSFCKLKSITLPDTCLTTSQKADYILNSYSEDWNAYRCDLIASMVNELSEKVHSIKPDLKINVHAVPWRDGDFGGANIRVAAQDLQKIAPFTDLISPMCYSQMLRRDASWIGSVVTGMDKKAPGKILPSIQVYPYYVDDPYTVEDFKECIDEALKAPSRGVVFFSWPLFEKDPERMEINLNLKL
ncbi:MAG: hypothetical protein NTW82_07670 [Bacteroidia bacterium]|nr:hypothetical protein [Bacteroidia bacterium]